MSANAPSTITCPHCGKQTSTATGFCDECGLELTSNAIKPVTAAEAMATGALKMKTTGLTCPYCGAALRVGARHCPNCGKKLPAEAGSTAAAEPTAAAAPTLATTP